MARNQKRTWGRIRALSLIGYIVLFISRLNIYKMKRHQLTIWSKPGTTDGVLYGMRVYGNRSSKNPLEQKAQTSLHHQRSGEAGKTETENGVGAWGKAGRYRRKATSQLIQSWPQSHDCHLFNLWTQRYMEEHQCLQGQDILFMWHTEPQLFAQIQPGSPGGALNQPSCPLPGKWRGWHCGLRHMRSSEGQNSTGQ